MDIWDQQARIEGALSRKSIHDVSVHGLNNELVLNGRNSDRAKGTHDQIFEIIESVNDYDTLWDELAKASLLWPHPRNLIESPDDESSNDQPATTFGRVDPSTMKTEIGRQMAGQLNRRLETSETQLHRLTQVLNEYFFYTRNYQLDLAEAAIIWAIAAFASHERRDECESNLYAISDIMYVSTVDAEKTLSESNRQQIKVAARAVAEHLLAGVRDVFRASAKKLATYEKGNILRMAAEILHLVQTRYLDHAPAHLLPTLIGHCLILCVEIDRYELGLCSEALLAESIQNVFKSSSEISKAVLAAIKSGDLVVQDGVIVNPNPESDVE